MKEQGKTVNWILKNYPYTIGEEVCEVLRKYRDGLLVEITDERKEALQGSSPIRGRFSEVRT